MKFRVVLTLTALLFPAGILAAELISVNSSGNDSGNGSSFVPSEEISPFSSDGRFIVFSSGAEDLGPMDTNGSTDVYLRDRQAGTTEMISVNSAGNNGGNMSSSAKSISADGRYVLFTSNASDLVATETPIPRP